MANEDESRWIAFNGEIFNHASLRPGLEAAGHRYHSRTDTETILHAFEQHGPECLQLFRGMFAFAIWDAGRRQLFCARDRLGIKPFYWWSDGRVFAFASEIKALLEHPLITPSFDREGLAEYLALGYRAGEETMFSGIRKLMPGHWMTISAAGDRLAIETRQYWDPPAPGVVEERSEEEWIADCRRRLEETVRMRLMSDVPLGVFLSGGVDSGAIAALMKGMVPDRVKSFSVGYREAAYSELPNARRTAEALGTDHHEVQLGPDEFFDLLPRLIWHEDEPICWPSSVSLFVVSRLASQEVKVVLTGEGSDEIFAGYSRYGLFLRQWRAATLWGRFPSLFRRAAKGLAEGAVVSPDLRRKLGHTFVAREATVESLYLDNFLGAFDQRQLAALGVEGPSYSAFQRHWARHPGAPALQRLLYADQKTYLVELLMKQDQMSMACSIESRVPLLDHTLVEFASRVPGNLKLHSGKGKLLFKRVVEDLLPHEIVWGPKKGFPTPLRAWLCNPARLGAVSTALLDKDGLLASFLDLDAVAALLDAHAGGRQDATDRLWRLLNLQLWGSLFITGGREAARYGHSTL